MGRKIIYAGSFDPAHNGHLNTYLKARRLLDEDIDICICHNELKEKGLFDLEERINIAKATFPTCKILLFKTSAEINEMISNADLIIRGYRRTLEKLDKDYSMRLMSYYNCSELTKKIVFIEIDAEFETVSSSMIKEMAKTDINTISQYVTKEAFPLILKKYANQ